MNSNYPVYRSKALKNDKNIQSWQPLLEKLKNVGMQSQQQGNPKAIKKHIESGKLLARQRIQYLLDEDSPFLELMSFAGFEQKGSTLGASCVTGIGLICGTECFITASVPTMKGGALNKMSVLKFERASEIILQNRLPAVNLIESAGADLTQQAEVFHNGGGSFRNLCVRSKAGIPTITVVTGNCTAGGAYSVANSDYSIMVHKQAKVFLAGPPLVKMATGEVVDDESLGGAQMHSKISGVSDYLVYNEYQAILRARELIETIRWKKKTTLPEIHFNHPTPPKYDIQDIISVINPNHKIPFDAREVICRVVDGSQFNEFKPDYGTTMVTGWAYIHGIPVGIIANNGVIFSEASLKATQFIHLCNQRNIPIIFFQNITGFMVGKKYEQGGIIRHGAHLINAVSNSGVPAITIVIGASFGAGNYAMCGRSYKPRFLFSWPNSNCSVMGEEQLSGVLDILQRERFRGQKIPPEIEKNLKLRQAAFQQQVKKQNDVFYTSSHLVDDGIIDPRDTRSVLGFCLSSIYSNEVKGDNHFGVSRM